MIKFTGEEMRAFGLMAVIATVIILIATFAHAQDNQQDAIAAMKRRPGKITCAMVKMAVNVVGAEEAERLARKDGASEARIAKWKRCK
jgi:hypothetical protein